MSKANKNRKIVSEKPMQLIILPGRDGGNANPPFLILGVAGGFRRNAARKIRTARLRPAS
jgi:hypothetical protein